MWYEWFSSDEELEQYAAEHRNQSDRQPLHLIAAMDYRTRTALGCSGLDRGESGFIFDCNILGEAKLRTSGCFDDQATGEYLRMRDYLALHELGHQFGLERCPEASFVMREFVPSPVPVSARFCSSCSSAVWFGARQLTEGGDLLLPHHLGLFLMQCKEETVSVDSVGMNTNIRWDRL